MKPQVTNKWLYVTVLSVIALAFGAMVWITGKEYDTLLFEGLYLRLGGNGNGDAIDWNAWADYASYQWWHDNVRLPNLICPLVTLFTPEWLELIIFGGAMMVMAAAVERLCAQGEAIDWRRLVMVWLLIAVALPWRGAMFNTDYALNYIVGGGVATGLLWLMWSNRGSRVWSSGLTAAGVLLAVVVGWWHEGFAVPLCAGMIALIALRRVSLRSTVTALTLVTLVVAVACVNCRGMMQRIAGENNALNWTWRTLVYDNAFVWCNLGVWTASAMSWGVRRFVGCEADDSLWMLTVVASLSGVVLYALGANGARAAFPAELYAIVGCGLWIWPLLRRLRRRCLLMVSACVASALVVQEASAIVWMIRLRRQQDEIVTMMKGSPHKTVYYDMIKPWNVPWYTLGYADPFPMLNYFNYNCLAISMPGDELAGSAVVPTCLDADLAQVEMWSVGEAMKFEGHLLAQYDESQFTWYNGWRTIEVVTVDGDVKVLTVSWARFADAAGNEWIYLMPNTIPWDDVTSVKLLDQ